MLARIRADNAAAPDRALAILYHVGEAFGSMSLASAARWVHTAHTLGAHRLGHALALGLDPAVAPQGAVEPVGERRAHLAWLARNAGWLGDHGHVVDEAAVRAELARVDALPADAQHVPVARDAAAQADDRSLQRALQASLAAAGAIVECCPTSNLRLAELASLADHPLPAFAAAGLTVVVGADDPGLFVTTLEREGRLCAEAFALDLPRVAAATTAARSGGLVGRGDK
jgi:adenosine deaminase